MILEVFSDVVYEDVIYPLSNITINVTHYFEQSPQDKWYVDSDWDAQGYTELEWEIPSVTIWQRNVKQKELTDPQEIAKVLYNEEDVEQEILKQIKRGE